MFWIPPPPGTPGGCNLIFITVYTACLYTPGRGTLFTTFFHSKISLNQTINYYSHKKLDFYFFLFLKLWISPLTHFNWTLLLLLLMRYNCCTILQNIYLNFNNNKYRVSHETWQYAGRLECRLAFWYDLLRLFFNLILEVNF